MNKKEAISFYKQHIKKIKAYRLVLSTTLFDRRTIAPKDGNAYRNEMLPIVQGEVYQLQTDPKYIETVLYLAELDLGEVMNREISLAKKSLENTLKFTKEEMMEFSMTEMMANDAWLKAKKNNDYGTFEPGLVKLIELRKKQAQKRDPKKNAYDIFLDDFQEGMDRKKYDHFFSLVKKELLPLIKKINRKQDLIDDSFLYKYYPVELQAKFSKDILDYINFSSDWGYLGETEHPFTNGLCRNDIRITTHYYDHNIAAAIYSVIHEAGHGFYGHQVDPKFDDYMFLSHASSGMHESQSRFLENYIGRRRSFFKLLYGKLQEYFPENLENVSLDQFIAAVNVSKCTLIRTAADELTYPIHIMIRYELEKDIFAGKADLSKLDELWDEKYQKYLGIHADNVSEGILQDIHWSNASFGYFPTYALGSAIGAQLMHKMQEDIDVDAILEKGQFKKITDYLKKNVQCYGNLYDFEEVLMRSTGENFNPQYYIDYLKNKYSAIYKIK
ncbi:MAG: carboxypeptidase M32 [Erysipelotrichaceae bacterium]|nr:carboxypeptidase M32 [Erysipelotrichaceae bacterium]